MYTHHVDGGLLISLLFNYHNYSHVIVGLAEGNLAEVIHEQAGQSVKIKEGI